MKALNDVNYLPSSFMSGTAMFAEMIKRKRERVDELPDATLVIFREFVMTHIRKVMEVEDTHDRQKEDCQRHEEYKEKKQCSIICICVTENI